MTNSELSEYILHYVLEDRTKSAIMLTGGWGTGKSYYIQNELIPFLGKEENNNLQCVVISLYGLKSVEEISKSLYIETRMKFLPQGSEKFETGKIIAKTVLKGLTGAFGIDLSQSNEDFQKLYESIDLSGKLVILEDIERSSINIIDVLGYVNNLVEEDGVKVLLVVNEDEILHYETSEPDSDGKIHKIPDLRKNSYLDIKEKTISDTIQYRGDIHTAISNLIQSFDSPTLREFSAADQIDNIVTMMDTKKDYNLRTFLFACQKASDIYTKLNDLAEVDECAVQTIFYGILSLSMEIKRGSFPIWEGSNLLSGTMGHNDFPLYRFCYDYIRWQEFNPDIVHATFEAHKKMKLFDREGESIPDKDFLTIFNYHVYAESEVISALESVEKRLDDPNDVPVYSYYKLAFYMVKLHTILDFDYTSCKIKMSSNLKKHGKDIDPEMLLFHRLKFEDENENQQFLDFIQTLQDAMEFANNTDFIFSYNPDEIHSLYLYVVKNRQQATAGHAFISKYEIGKLVKMIFACNPCQLSDWRSILLSVYRHSIKGDFLDADRLFMEDLIIEIEEALGTVKDKICLMHLNYLISNLKEFIEQLS